MSSYLARSALTRPYEGFPAYGAVHDVLPNEHLRHFLYKFSQISDAVFRQSFDEPTDEGVVAAEVFEPVFSALVAAPEYDPRRFYRIFDVESLGVSVVEMDPTAKTARQFRTLWEGHDFGAVEQEAKNELPLPGTGLRLMFNRVDGVGRRLPGVSRSDVRQKLALMPDTDQFIETLDTIEEEADVIIGAIRRRLKQFVYNWDIMPHLTFSVFRQDATLRQIKQVKTEANDYLQTHPFTVSLGNLDFRHKKLR